jgi:Putative prokaryotic signal transducing protein
MTNQVKCPLCEGGLGWLEVAGRKMKELLRTNNVVRLSWAEARLREAGIDSLVLDHHTSLVEGSIGAIPRRLMVAERDHRRASALIAAAEEELR